MAWRMCKTHTVPRMLITADVLWPYFTRRRSQSQSHSQKDSGNTQA